MPKKNKRLIQSILILAGSVTLALGFVGVLIPVLPTTPFVLVSLICFANSSEKLHAKLIKSKIYNNTVERFLREKGMTLKAKLSITIPVGILLTVLVFLFDNLWIRIIIITLFIIKIIVFIRIPTIKRRSDKSL